MELDVFRSFAKKIPARSWACFISSMLVGWFTHFYMFTHKLPNWDDVNYLNGYGAGRIFGRWFLEIVHKIGGQYSVPAIHGVLMIFFIAMSACLVVELLQLKSMTAAVLIGALMVSFPSVACVMTFMFTAHSYGLTILMICFAVYVMHRYKWGWIPCLVLLVCSLGVYQSYISIAIALMLMSMIVEILHGQEWKKVLRMGISYAVILVLAVVIYIPLCFAICPEMVNESYGGVNQMGQITLTEMPILIARCYKRFLEYFIWKPFAYMSSFMQVLNILTCVAAFIGVGALVVIKKLYQKPLEFVLFGMACFFMPWAVAFVYFMAPEAPFSVLMLYAYVMIYVLVIALWEKLIIHWKGQNIARSIKISTQLFTIFVVGVISLSCYDNYLLTNTAYMRMEISYERVVAYFNRILANVEATEGYVQGDAVTILGDFYHVDNPSPVDISSHYPTEPFREMSGVTLENGLVTSGVRDVFIRNFLGFEVAGLTPEEKSQIKESEAFKTMPRYPEEGSIAQIDGIWVVKISD